MSQSWFSSWRRCKQHRGLNGGFWCWCKKWLVVQVTTLEHKQVLLHPGQHQSPSTGLGSAGRPPSGLARNVSNDYARHSREQR